MATRFRRMLETIAEFKQHHTIGTKDALSLCRLYAFADDMLDKLRDRDFSDIGRTQLVRRLDHFCRIYELLLNALLAELTKVYCDCKFNWWPDNCISAAEKSSGPLGVDFTYNEFFRIEAETLLECMIETERRMSNVQAKEDALVGVFSAALLDVFYSTARSELRFIDLQGTALTLDQIAMRIARSPLLKEILEVLASGEIERFVTDLNSDRRGRPDFSPVSCPLFGGQTSMAILQTVRQHPFLLMMIWRRSMAQLVGEALKIRSTDNAVTEIEIQVLNANVLYTRAVREQTLSALDTRREIALAIIQVSVGSHSLVEQHIDASIKLYESRLEKLFRRQGGLSGPLLQEDTRLKAKYSYFVKVLSEERAWLLQVLSK